MKKKFSLLLTAVMLAAALAGCDPLPESLQDNNSSSATETNAASGVITASDYDYLEDGRETLGYGEGRVNDTFETLWFTFKVENVSEAETYEEYTPAEGYKLLLAEITVKNIYSGETMMFYDDFQLQWLIPDSSERDFGYAIEAFTEEMVPEEYTLKRAESATYLYVFEIPADTEQDYSISFQEYYEDGEYGNVYFCWFDGGDIK